MRKFILMGVLLFFIWNLSFADSDSPVDNTFESFGYTYTLNKNQVEIDIDRDKVLSSIPELQASGAINPELTQTGINLNKDLISTSVSIFFTCAIVPEIYKNTNLDEVHFRAYLMSPDDYGNNKKHLIYSFNFNRKLNEKINWDNMTANSFMKVAPGFRFSEWYDQATGI